MRVQRRVQATPIYTTPFHCKYCIWCGGTTATWRFALDGWDPAKANAIGTENFDVWARLDGSNALIARFVFGPGVDEVIGRQDPGVVTAWYLVDYQGSVRRVVNNVDTVLATTRYSAYGQILDGSIYGGYGYTGREYDGVIGGIGDAWYCRARIFLPDLGKFLSEDPIGFQMGENNLYRYVGNSPTNATDPSGLDKLEIEGDGNIVWETTKLNVAGFTQGILRFKVGTLHSDGSATISDYGGSGTVNYHELDQMVAFGSRLTPRTPGQDRAHRGYGSQSVQNELIKAEIRLLKSYKPAAGAGPEPYNPFLDTVQREDESRRPVMPQMSAMSPADIARSERLRLALKEQEEAEKLRADFQWSMSQANPCYNPDWDLLERVWQRDRMEAADRWNRLTAEEKVVSTLLREVALGMAFALWGNLIRFGPRIAPRPVPSLPKYDGGKTSGVLRFGNSDIPLLSGYKGPSASMPKGTPGMNGNIKSHVEAHAAAIMRQQGLSEATLYINRIPCPGKTGCDAMLPRLLPEGARLRVIGPDGFERIYVGLPD